MPSFDLMTYPDFPVLVARWGIWFLAALTLLGSETVVALAGFLCWIGILQAPQSFTAAFLAAFAAAFRNRAGSPVARFFVSQTLLERRLPLYRETLPAVLFYRFLPQKKARFPLLAAQSPTLTSVRFLIFAAIGSLLWASAILAIGGIMGAATEAVAGSRSAIWNRLPGFLLLMIMIFPLIRFILLYEMDKITALRQSKRK